jgi:Kinetochore complex Fta4 of Sim4 subunit, or CENP-50
VKDLDARRQALRQKVAGYKALKETLAPFENATETVQQNLVVRGGELENELERMRLLIARVRGRLDGLPVASRGEEQGQRQGEEMDVDPLDEEAKIKKLLGGT